MTTWDFFTQMRIQTSMWAQRWALLVLDIDLVSHIGVSRTGSTSRRGVVSPCSMGSFRHARGRRDRWCGER